MNADDNAEKALIALVERGVSASADRLAKISRTNWVTQTTSIQTAPLKDFFATLQADHSPHYGVYSTMPGGVFLFIFRKNQADALSKLFLTKNTPNQSPEIQRIQQDDALSEISNIVVHAVANVFADACDQAFFLSAPRISMGTKSELLTAAPTHIRGSDGKAAVMAYVHMSAQSLSCDCTLVMILSAPLRQTLLTALSS